MMGFLGTRAGFAADLNLVVQLAIGALLVAGAMLARSQRYSAHGICMAVALFLNLVMTMLVMWPSFHELVLPGIVKHWSRRSEMVAVIHGALGAAVELFGIYVVLVAGTTLIPRRWRFRDWKRWMRAEFAVWWVVLLLGIATYLIWYGAPHFH